MDTSFALLDMLRRILRITLDLPDDILGAPCSNARGLESADAVADVIPDSAVTDSWTGCMQRR